MFARQAVLLNPAKPSGPTQLLSCQQNTPVSPLFATLTSHPQPTENTATLSPFPATLTASAPVTPVFATLTQTAGCPILSSHSGTPHSPFPARHLSLECGSSAAASCFQTPVIPTHLLFMRTEAQTPPLHFQSLAHSFALTREGAGCPAASSRTRSQFR